MPFAERRKINMKKRKNLGKKLVTMLVSVGFFAVLITVLNLMALQAIRGKNNVLIEQFEQYEEAVENNDTAVFETAKGEVAEAIRHINYRINGSIIFDLALVVADIIVIVLLSMLHSHWMHSYLKIPPLFVQDRKIFSYLLIHSESLP